VLVHGACHGGWCWSRVRGQLHDRGHRVFTPTLTGLGERCHLLSADITLGTHIDDVVNVIRWEDLDDVILVGHSYAGWVISGAAERVLPRLASLVFVDAAVPDDGQSIVTQSRPEMAERIRAVHTAGGLALGGPSAAVYGVKDPADQAWVDSKLTDHPVGTYFSTIALTGARERVPRKTFVLATGYGEGAARARFGSYRDRVAKTPGWRIREIAASHDVMIDAPDELVKVLLEEAAASA
jgi:pimeloyl-ACP methyl ester carboxylesterase